MIRPIKGWRLFRVREVDLKVHPSLLFLLAYVVLVASMQFPAVVRQSGVDPSLLLGSALSWGVIFAIALFFSVILHEFGHVVMAQMLGVKVRGITLMILGGVSEMERIPEEKYSEFKIAIVGPFVSFVIAGALLLIGWGSSSSNIDLFCYWLSRVNLALGIFNLLPAFPLDGGRAFRSLISAHRGPSRATAIASGLGKSMAWILGALGLLGGNLLLMLIAVFIYMAANQELALISGRGLLNDMTAGEAGTRVSPLSLEDTLTRAAERMLETRLRVLPVEGPEPGILDLSRLRAIPRERRLTLLVRDVMDRAPRSIRTDEYVGNVLPELAASGALPLLANGQVIGVLQYRDLSDLIELRSLDEDRIRRAA